MAKLQIFEFSCHSTVSDVPFPGNNPIIIKNILFLQENIFILALQISHFPTLNLTYVDKIDTSGYFNRNSANYSISDIVVDVLSKIPGRIHVFARAQPQFLFHLSANNPLKHILTERELVLWWAKTLNSLIETKTQGWFYIPGETESSVKNISNQFKGNFGFPYKNSKEIPKFKDDVKSKGLELLENESTLEEFKEILSATGECGSGRFSGIFIIDNLSKESAWTDGETIDKVCMMGLMNEFLNKEWDLRAEGIKSTEWMKEKLEKIGVKGRELKIDERQCIGKRAIGKDNRAKTRNSEFAISSEKKEELRNSQMTNQQNQLNTEIVKLRNTWVFWFMHRSQGSKVSDYNSSIKQLASFSSIQEFWSVYSYLKRPSELGHVTEYHMFKQGIKPIWEDNLTGGKWIFRLKKGISPRLWESLVLAVVGDQFEAEVGEEISGIVISIRNGEDIISVWNKHAGDGRVEMKIRDMIKRILNLPSNSIMEYKAHKASVEDKSSFRNTASYL